MQGLQDTAQKGSRCARPRACRQHAAVRLAGSQLAEARCRVCMAQARAVNWLAFLPPSRIAGAASPATHGPGGAQPAGCKRARLPASEQESSAAALGVRHPLQELALYAEQGPLPAQPGQHAVAPPAAAPAASPLRPMAASSSASKGRSWLRSAAHPRT